MNDEDDKRNRPGKISSLDQKLWDFITRDIKPLIKPATSTPDTPRKPTPPAKVRQAVIPDIFSLGPGLKDSALPPARPDPFPELDRSTAEKLRKGKMPIEATLDLHGLTQAAAHDRLIRFIVQASQRQYRCLLIITGKGRSGEDSGILRRRFPDWLAQPPVRELILRHTPAQPRDGGSGAFYVLLRRQR